MAQTTQSDIAKKLNVTRITVSKALRDHPDISTKMKKLVCKMADELGYTPNLIAKNLSSKKTFTIGVVVPDLENSFFAYVVDSMIDEASENNYHMILTISRENEQNEISNIRNLLGMRVDGLLVCVSQQTKDSQIYDQVNKMNIPLVFFDRQIEGLGFNNVKFNDKKCGEQTLDKIIQEGYGRIAHFAGYTNVSIGRDRLEAYQSALRKNNLSINKEWIIEGGFEITDGYNAFMKMYQKKDLPEIIFTVNDRVALGAYSAIKEVGLKIPEDIGLVAFGFNETAKTFIPPLAIINQDPRQMGHIAVDTLIKVINLNTTEKPQEILIDEEFVWNSSIVRKQNKI